jgi:hypothetical protein
MKQTASVITALAVVLAIFGVSSLPKSSPNSGTETGPERRSKQAQKAPGDKTKIYACSQIQERLRVLMADHAGDSWRLPDSCYGPDGTSDQPRTAPEDVVFAIATAPNPISTHLPMQFDRVIEIVEQAAQDNNYTYDSSWLPWNAGREYARYPDEQAYEDSQSETKRQPGILVFRKPLGASEEAPYKGGLVVFVVAELPTGGIDQEQFGNALAWIKTLGHLTPERKLRILGPTFSGSLPSLYRLLRSDELRPFAAKAKQRHEPTIIISSGSVTSDFLIQWFTARLKEENLGTFQTALEGDCRVLKRFVAYVEREGYETKQIAILSEDETAFGGGVAISDDSDSGACEYNLELTYLYYPRDIAMLRSAYEQQSLLGSSKQGASSTNTSGTALRGDLSEPENSEHDTVRTYGGQLTPLAQESVLFSIAEVLKAKQIEFVVLRSTNSLDQIFLSQFLRRSFPDARLVIDGSDLLFRRGAEGTSLRGVMMLSTYPLLTWQPDWTSKPQYERASYRIFGQDSAEGLYIAARELLLNDPTPLDPPPSVKIADYAPPAWARLEKDENEEDDSRPATWLAVIGHRQFWPVAVLNSNTLKDASSKSGPPDLTDSLLQVASDRNGLIEISGNPDPIRYLPADFQVLLILCFVWGLLHFLFCWYGSISPVPAPFRLAYFAPVPGWQYPALIGVGMAVVVTVGVLLAFSSGLLNWELGAFNKWVATVVAWVILLSCIGCAINYRMPTMACGKVEARNAALSRLISAGACVVFLVVFIEIRVGLHRHLITANRIPLLWRNIHLLSGVSPLLPQLILAAGLYAWFWFSLRGLALFGDDRPQLPSETDLPIMNGKNVMAMFSRERAGEGTEAEAMPLGKDYLLILALVFPIVLSICSVVLRDWGLRTLGERNFGVYMFVWLTVCIAVILADAAQCWLSWQRLRNLLVHLDRLAVRRTLYGLRGLSWQSVWAMSGNVLAERYSLISRQLEAMRHLENQLESLTADDMDLHEKADLIKKIRDFQKDDLPEFIGWYVDLDGKPVTTIEPICDVQAKLAYLAAETLKVVLLPAWRLEKESLIFERTEKKDKDSDSRSGPIISAKIFHHVLAAEEFFVLPYIGFIQNILGRIRTIVLGSLWLFVATTLAVSSYPFDPLPTLGGIFLAVFVIIGTTMILIYAGMHRDATLSYITGSEPGELGGEFWRQLFTFGIGPLLGLLTTLFPSITDFVVSWLQPSSQAIK